MRINSADDYQALARRTQSCKTKEDRARHGVFGLTSEAGEVAVTWYLIRQKKYQGHSIDREYMAKELGDCLWMIAEICDAFGLSLAEVMGKNIEKLRERYPDGFEAEKSLHRKDGDI